jgi:hypothetical protein
MKARALAATLAFLSLAAVAAGGEEAGVSFPAGWRKWTHVKSMVIQEGHPLHDSFGGLHHLYANAPALEGYRSGRFPDGSVLVFDLLEAVASGHAIEGGSRKVLGVMQKDARRFAATGGWGFEGFAQGDPARPVVGADAATACFQCHTSQKDQDFVFSRWKE